MVSTLAVYVDMVVYIYYAVHAGCVCRYGGEYIIVSTLAVYVDTVVYILCCPHWLCM